MTKNKKIIISVIVGIVIIAIVTTGTILAMNIINNNKKVEVAPTQASTKALRDKAETARKNNDKTKAKELLLEAQQQIKELPKTDETVNAQVDVEAQLWLLAHPSTPAATPVTPAPTTP